MDTKQILCMKWGTLYGPAYVNILYAMVARNITGPFQMICFTDDARGIREEVRCLPLPELGCTLPKHDQRGRKLGQWPKVALWNRELFDLKGVGLFIDLDSVIVDNLDGYFTHGEPGDVITARNWVKPLTRMGQTSVFRFPIGGHPYMLEDLRADPTGVACHYRFEQNYVTQHIRGGIKFWPSPWTRHFRVHCMGPVLLRYLRPPIKPRGAKIITFPGHLKPEDAIAGGKKGLPARAPLEHLRWMWSQRKTGRRWWSHFQQYSQPCDWLKEHWRE